MEVQAGIGPRGTPSWDLTSGTSKTPVTGTGRFAAFARSSELWLLPRPFGSFDQIDQGPSRLKFLNCQVKL